MKKSIDSQDRWRRLYVAKRKALKMVKSLQSLQNLDIDVSRLKEIFNNLFDLVENGATILQDKYGNWYVELVDGTLLDMNSQVMNTLYTSLSEESKRFIKIDSTSNFSLDAWENQIREYPDFPKEGILFYDIMPAIADPHNVTRICMQLILQTQKQGFVPTKIAALETRGIFFGVVLSQLLDVPFLPIRKKGKLPGEVVSQSYGKEYGEDAMEIQKDALSVDDSILIVDDVLATGGTAEAAGKLIAPLVKDYAFAFVIRIKSLKGEKKIGNKPVFCLLQK